MASILTTKDPSKKSAKKILSQGKPSPQFIQFVPGIVKRVVTNNRSIGHGRQDHINTILAVPHISDRVPADNDGIRYFPLLRGMVDVPAAGDPVLLCTFGDKNYYLGPINTKNSPNFNVDEDYIPFQFEKTLSYSNVPGFENYDTLDFTYEKEESDISYNFPRTGHKRLTKQFNPVLDANGNVPVSFQIPNPEDVDIYPIHGDMIFEGRHGNSIRIGSRSSKPYMFINNGRPEGVNGQEESLEFGSLISLTSKHSIREWFSPGKNPMTGKPSFNFSFASDRRAMIQAPILPDGSENLHFNRYKLSDLHTGHLFNDHQIFIASDGISLNARSQPITISSLLDIYMGGGENIVFKAPRSIRLNSKNIILGGDTVKNEKGNLIATPTAEPVVLGERLSIVLTELLQLLSAAQVQTQAGPQPLIDSEMLPLSEKFDTMVSNLGSILSKQVYTAVNVDSPEANLRDKEE
tara:strand:- start:237 stop:1628 length:1392 start_codon:yes stop_codon:yes gene_type:complete